MNIKINKQWLPFSKMESANGYVMINKDDYVRARECVNAMSGVLNPMAAILELQKLRAENVRLQSVIDEANAQEPLTTIQVLQGYPHVVSHSQCGVKDGIYKVYAERPTPAQQSTAVAVPDEIPHDDYADNESKAHRRGWNDCREEMLRNIAKPSPRITEQDGECVHEWVSAVNKVVRSGEICLKCFALRAGASE